ncbi:hypothetical protein PAMA_009867 [Pampus argenteus]
MHLDTLCECDAEELKAARKTPHFKERTASRDNGDQCLDKTDVEARKPSICGPDRVCLQSSASERLISGIPLVCFLVLLPLNIPWSQISVTWLGVVHFLACLSPQLGSVLYHLFMNHEGGEPVYHTLLKLDVCGICMINTLGALPIVYSTLLCYPFIRTVALLVYILLSSHAIYCAVTARSSVRRLRSFAWQALFRFSFFLLRWVGVGGGSPTSLRHFLTMDALAVLGGVINITRIPERFRPGLFDYWCNSHQIMHVLVVGSILYLHWGVLDDLLWINSYNCPSD